jgi:hypothetical protein
MGSQNRPVAGPTASRKEAVRNGLHYCCSALLGRYRGTANVFQNHSDQRRCMVPMEVSFVKQTDDDELHTSSIVWAIIYNVDVYVQVSRWVYFSHACTQLNGSCPVTNLFSTCCSTRWPWSASVGLPIMM